MKKLKGGEVNYLFGTVFMALGVAICSKSGLGVSMIAAPPFIVYEALGHYWSGFSVGMFEYLVQGLLIAIMCLIIRRFDWRFLLSFVTAVIYGLFLDMWLAILGAGQFGPVWLRWVMLIVGDASVSLGVAFYFRTYLPLQAYELFVSEFSGRFGLKVTAVKWGFDLSFLALSAALAFGIFRDAAVFDWSTIYYNAYHSIGAGTVVTTIINAPLIGIFGKILDMFIDNEPIFPKLHKFLARGGAKTDSPTEDAVPIAEGTDENTVPVATNVNAEGEKEEE